MHLSRCRGVHAERISRGLRGPGQWGGNSCQVSGFGGASAGKYRKEVPGGLGLSLKSWRSGNSLESLEPSIEPIRRIRSINIRKPYNHLNPFLGLETLEARETPRSLEKELTDLLVAGREKLRVRRGADGVEVPGAFWIPAK